MSEQGVQVASGIQFEEVLTLAEAAAFLRVSEDAVSALADNDAIPAQKIGGEWRFLKRALADWLRYGRHAYREFRGLPPTWLFEFPPMERLTVVLEKLLSKLSASEEKSPKPGSKQAVLKHFGVLRDDDDLEARLAETRSQREGGG